MDKRQAELMSIHGRQRGLLVVVILALIIAFFLIEKYDVSLLANTGAVRNWVASYGVFAPLAYIFLMSLAIVIVPIPDFVIGLAAAILFPWYLATIYTLIGDFIGSSLTFFLARRFGRLMVKRFVKKEELVKIDTLATTLGVKTVFILRLIPGFNFDLIGYLAGLTSLSYTGYILATMLGILPRRVGTYYLIDKSIQIDPLIMLIAIIFSMLTVPVLVYSIWQRKRQLAKD